jgi:hypothetical protein
VIIFDNVMTDEPRRYSLIEMTLPDREKYDYLNLDSVLNTMFSVTTAEKRLDLNSLNRDRRMLRNNYIYDINTRLIEYFRR